jgi:hypothetical protein
MKMTEKSEPGKGWFNTRGYAIEEICGIGHERMVSKKQQKDENGQLKKKGGYLLLILGFMVPLISFSFSEKYEGEGSWITHIYEGEIIFREGTRIKEIKREGMGAVPKIGLEEAKKNLGKMADSRISQREKGEILAAVDPEFRSLPAGEREKVLAVLTPGELAGVFISAAGYRIDQVLGSGPYTNKSSVPYRYVLTGGILLIFLGALLLII